MALAYLLGKGSAKPLRISLNVPLILVLSTIPDIDIILMTKLHRGPTHSIIMAVLVFIPVFFIYRKKAVPYFIALASHSLLADFFIGGQVQLLWPLSTQKFGLHELGLYYINISSPINVALELTLFAVATVVMWRTRDLLSFLRSNKNNLILTIPIFTVLLPTFFAYPLPVPILLAPPHLFYLVLFTYAVLVFVFQWFRKKS
jgi:membrane-bound metal-dependent hydrolase YbcI (DUF457 family)